jgi:hypothetical protein
MKDKRKEKTACEQFYYWIEDSPIELTYSLMAFFGHLLIFLFIGAEGSKTDYLLLYGNHITNPHPFHVSYIIKRGKPSKFPGGRRPSERKAPNRKYLLGGFVTRHMIIFKKVSGWRPDLLYLFRV